MDIWAVLDLSETRDKTLITEAYRKQLKLFHPEEHPEEFKQLRAAYEQALQIADQQPDAPIEDTPVTRWLDKAKAVYAEFPNRIRTDKWEELLRDPVCTQLDSKDAARNALLEYLMTNFRVPMEVWRAFDAHFGLVENQAELLTLFPRNFILQGMLSLIRYPQQLPYDLFSLDGEGENYDRFIMLYSTAVGNLRENKLDEVNRLVAEMNETGIRHPYTALLNLRYLQGQGRSAEAHATLDALLRRFPDEREILHSKAALYTWDKDFASAKELCLRLLELNEKNDGARVMLAECQLNLDDPVEAKETLLVTLRRNPYDLAAHNFMRQTNEVLTVRYAEQHKNDPQDATAAAELAWCYLQTQKQAEAAAIAQKLKLEQPDAYEYYALLARTSLGDKEYQKSLSYFEHWEQAIRALPADSSDKKTVSRRERLPEVLLSQADLHQKLGDPAKAFALVDAVVALDRDCKQAQETRLMLLFKTRDYRAAIDLASQLIADGQESHAVYYYRAYSYYAMGLLQEAHYDAETAISLLPSDGFLYLLQLRILVKAGAWDYAKERIKFLDENKFKSDTLTYLKGRLAAQEGDSEGALKAYKKVVANRKTADCDPGTFEELYIAYLEARKDSLKLSAQMNIIEDGLGFAPDSVPLLVRKATCFEKQKRRSKAIPVYERIIELSPQHPFAYSCIARCHHDGQRYAQALGFYEAQLEVNDNGYDHEMAGRCCRQLRLLDKAELHFRASAAFAPDSPGLLADVADVQALQFHNEDAIGTLLAAVGLAKSQDIANQRGLWTQLASLYRRSGNPQSALAVYDEAIALFKDNSLYADKISTCLQFNLIDEAKAVLKHWRRVSRPIQSAFRRTLLSWESKIQMQQGRLFIAAQSASGGWLLTKLSNNEHALNLYYSCQYRQAYAEYADLLNNAKNNVHLLIYAAKCAYFDRKPYLCQKHCEEALELIKLRRRNYPPNEAIMLTQKSELLSLLGRFDEAWECIEMARRAPLCDFCTYARCKDAELATALYHELKGELAQAADIYEANAALYPDDLDFKYGALRVRRSMKKR